MAAPGNRRLAIRPSTGVWKIAYADFVTAMMALFLLLWMVNTTSPDQKRGIAEYFAPPSISKSPSGFGGMFGGQFSVHAGKKAGDGMPLIVPDEQLRPALEDQRHPSPDQGKDDGRARREARLFASARTAISQALAEMPETGLLGQTLAVVPDPQGVRLEFTSPDNVPLFIPDSAAPTPRFRKLMRQMALLLDHLPNRVILAGHAAAGETGRWGLSSARAQLAMEVLLEHGISESRFHEIAGKGSTDPVFAEAPGDPENRRISLILLIEAAPIPPDHSLN